MACNRKRDSSAESSGSTARVGEWRCDEGRGGQKRIEREHPPLMGEKFEFLRPKLTLSPPPLIEEEDDEKRGVGR